MKTIMVTPEEEEIIETIRASSEAVIVSNQTAVGDGFKLVRFAKFKLLGFKRASELLSMDSRSIRENLL